jgi:hypothetical protein
VIRVFDLRRDEVSPTSTIAAAGCSHKQSWRYVAASMAGGIRLSLKMIRRGLAAEDAFQVNAEQAAELLAQLVALGLIEPVSPKPYCQSRVLNSHPVAKPLPNASAAKPVFERQRKHFCSSSWSESAVLFGSMLSEAERLGDVDIAIELLPKVAEQAEFRKWCDRCRYAAREQGKSFRSSFDWIFWPREEF